MKLNNVIALINMPFESTIYKKSTTKEEAQWLVVFEKKSFNPGIEWIKEQEYFIVQENAIALFNILVERAKNNPSSFRNIKLYKLELAEIGSFNNN